MSVPSHEASTRLTRTRSDSPFILTDFARQLSSSLIADLICWETERRVSQWHSRFVSPVYVGSCGGHACSDSARAHGRLRRVSFLSTALHSTASFTDNACVGVWVLGGTSLPARESFESAYRRERHDDELMLNVLRCHLTY